MAGHSKWANTKYKKSEKDAKRGKIFTKIIRDLVTAAKIGGMDPTSNPRLRLAMDKALSKNMTRETMNRAIARGVNTEENSTTRTITYECYGPGGTAIMIQCISDNSNRTVSEVRNALAKFYITIGNKGSVSYQFTKKGWISYTDSLNEDAVMEAALEAGAEDIFIYETGEIEVFTNWENVPILKKVWNNAYFQENGEFLILPDTKVDINTDNATKLLNMIDRIEYSDDVQEVYHNGEIYEK